MKDVLRMTQIEQWLREEGHEETGRQAGDSSQCLAKRC